METQTENTKKIYVETTTYKALDELATNKNMTIEQYVESLFKSATKFDSQHPQNEDEALIEVPLNAEQYTRLRQWLKDEDFIEVVTGPGEEKATLINGRKLEEKNHPDLKEAMGGEVLDFRVRLLSPFVDFIEQYLTFFNELDKLEVFIRRAVYEKVWLLHGDLTEFVKTKGHQLELPAWLEKFPERVQGNEDDKQEEKTQKA